MKGKFRFHNLVEEINWDFFNDGNINLDNKISMFIEALTTSFITAFPEKKL